LYYVKLNNIGDEISGYNINIQHMRNTGAGSVRARQVNYKINLNNNRHITKENKIIGWCGGGNLRDKACSEKSRHVVPKEMKPFTDGEPVEESAWWLLQN
jgi:hypothetical protein